MEFENGSIQKPYALFEDFLLTSTLKLFYLDYLSWLKNYDKKSCFT